MLYNHKITILLFAVISFFVQKPVFSHDMQIFADVSSSGRVQGTISSESKPIKGVKIEILARNGDVVAESTTDEKGYFSGQLAEPGRYRVTASLPDGHEAETTLAFSRKLESLLDKEPAPDKETAKETVKVAATPESEAATSEFFNEINENLYKIRQEIDLLRKHRYFSDIIGGVGYILGVVALFSLVGKRKTTKN